MKIDIIYNEDCIEVLKRLEDNSVDAIVTDPPYNLGFMGKKWDKTGIAFNLDLWKECLRVIKPGGNLLSFGGTRTYHRMVCAIEDAGWQIRDTIMWVYSTGFPKSLNIGKAVDKRKDSTEHDNKIEAIRKFLREQLLNYSREYLAQYCQVTERQIDHWFKENESQPQIPSFEKWGLLQDLIELEGKPDIPKIKWSNLGKIVKEIDSPISWYKGDGLKRDPTTPEAKLWEGYGTGLKPAYEPICLAMKPLDGTFAENCLKWGVGGLNIDGCRIPTSKEDAQQSARPNSVGKIYKSNTYGSGRCNMIGIQQGRFPANFILGYPEDEYELREGITTTERENVVKWLYENT